jgi:pSer/pThr/pTyr-binding forkhead associated (FHA) protein
MQGSKVTLTDNGSKFGSFVDGRRLSANEKVELSIGNELKFGQGPTTGTFK